MAIDEILSAIGSTEPSTFGEFCSALKDCPEKGDREAWAEIFGLLKEAEELGLVEVERTGKLIDSLVLTDVGADRVRAKFDGRRGLFQNLK
jgi:hypothetical protein